MKLFIANTTMHVQELLFRIPENPKMMRQILQPGSQQQIYQDAPKDVLEYIINQHTDTPKPFCIPAEEAGRQKAFAGLIYSFENPVKQAVIEGRFEDNTEALKKLGAEQRKESAVALNAALAAEAQQIGANVSEVEQTVQEETRRGDTSEGSKLNETVAVIHEGNKRGRRGNK